MKRLIFLFAALSIFATGQTDLAMFRGDLAHTGVYQGSGPSATHRIRWKFHTDARILASPVIYKNVVYVGSVDGTFYAIDLASGQSKWKFDTEGIIPGSAAVTNDVAYFESYDGNLYAVDVNTGKAKWTFATGGERRFAAKNLHGLDPANETMPDFWDFYLSSPAVANGIVYFGSGDGNVYAIDATSGSLKWKFQTGNVVHASPAIANNTVYIGSWDTYFYALDAATGKLKWKFKTGDDPKIHNQEGIQSSAAVADGMVYFGARDSHLYALDAATGEKKWADYNDRGWVSASPAVYQGKVYITSGSNKEFRILDAKTGAKTFSMKIEGGGFTSPTIANEIVYFAPFASSFIALDLKTNQVAWTWRVNEQLHGPAVNSLNLRFYDDGQARMAQRFGDAFFLSSPAIADGVLVVGNTDGNVYAIE